MGVRKGEYGVECAQRGGVGVTEGVGVGVRIESWFGHSTGYLHKKYVAVS